MFKYGFEISSHVLDFAIHVRNYPTLIYVLNSVILLYGAKKNEDICKYLLTLSWLNEIRAPIDNRIPSVIHSMLITESTIIEERVVNQQTLPWIRTKCTVKINHKPNYSFFKWDRFSSDNNSFQKYSDRGSTFNKIAVIHVVVSRSYQRLNSFRNKLTYDKNS